MEPEMAREIARSINAARASGCAVQAAFVSLKRARSMLQPGFEPVEGDTIGLINGVPVVVDSKAAPADG
jgi:hypothetical protein